MSVYERQLFVSDGHMMMRWRDGQEGQRHPPPPGTRSRPPRSSQRAQDAPQATTGGTGCGASTRRTPCPQRAHRCPTERGAGRGVQLPTRSTRTSHSRPGRAAEGARRIYLNMYRGTAAEPETRTAQGVAGTPRKKSSEFEKKC